ncbi:FAD-dependent oxidoreductase [Nonomuraea sp. FMUSA5-5]|uniref:FAD-dependent oxidoreductase n=1 Tax=Nonomuraea composti TaxID=2720023 RepID=A0ABX1BKC6_9ACTN|nr:FAD-dependent oxidoreductase [Nonomuraea sp. FMUSA5-5]NJP96982.1 FAD-dependent oxidoreductase [Nonomuraea sp. FMUSA5-5]
MAGNWPRSAIVVGAGIVGLSTAWFLQERGVEVDVVDRAGVAGGASWGNAGWVAPGLAIPLNEPAVLRYGLRSLLDPAAPLYVPAGLDLGLWRFLLRFAANSGWRSWSRAARANLPLNEECVEAYEVLAAGGVSAPVVDAPITAAFRTSRQAEGLLRELRRLRQVGQHVEHTVLDRDGLAEQVPLAGGELGAGVRIDGQRYVDPGAFVHALGEAVMRRGATVYAFEVDEVRTDDRKAIVRSAKGTVLSADAVVLATGAWLPRLARQWGVRVPVRAGRGYSFTVPVERPVPGPLYLPDVRVACTPYRGGLRVAGTMEFRDPDAPRVPARLEAIIASVRPLLRGVRWDERTDAWVGPRPITPDGRPLVGRTVAPTVYVAGGHGMWGLAQGPVTGRLLAEWITTGKQPEALADLDPLR